MKEKAYAEGKAQGKVEIHKTAGEIARPIFVKVITLFYQLLAKHVMYSLPTD